MNGCGGRARWHAGLLLVALCALWAALAGDAKADGFTALRSDVGFEFDMARGGESAFSFTAPLSGEYELYVYSLTEDDIACSAYDNAARSGSPIARDTHVESFDCSVALDAGETAYLWVADGTDGAAAYPFPICVDVIPSDPRAVGSPKTSRVAAAEGSTVSLHVLSNTGYSVTTGAGWLVPGYLYSDGGDETLTMTARANPYARPRMTNVYLAADEYQLAQFTVWQDPADVSMALNQGLIGAMIGETRSRYLFTASADGIYVFDVSSGTLNLAASLETRGTGEPAKTAMGGEIRLEARLSQGQTACLTLSNRTGEGQGEFRVEVVRGVLTASASTVYLSNAGGASSNFMLSASADWSASVLNGAAWLSLSPQQSGGAGTFTLRAQAAANDSASRTGTIEFTSTNSDSPLTTRVAVVQLALKSGNELALDALVNGHTQKGSSTWFSFTAPQTGYYVFSSASDLDTRVTLYAKLNSGKLASADGGGIGANFRLVRKLSAGQKVFLKVYGASSRVTGGYVLSVEMAQLTTDASAATLSATGGASQSINLASNLPWTASSGASWLKLSKSSGGAGTFALSAKAGSNETGVSRTATVTIQGGDRVVRVSIQQPPTFADPVLVENAPVDAILTAGKSQYYVFTASDAGLYLFETSGNTDTAGTLYTSRGGSRLTSDGDGGEGKNFRMTRTFAAGQRVWIKVSGGKSSTAGTYRIIARHAEIELSVTAEIMPNAGGVTDVVYFLSDVPWKAGSSASWLTLSAKSGAAGYGEIRGSAGANATGSTRTANIVLSAGGRTYSILVTQPAIATDVALRLDTPVGGTLQGYSVNWYAFTAPYADTYLFESSGSADPTCGLYTSKSRTAVQSDDDGGKGSNFLLVRSMSAGQTIYLKVSGATRYTDGEYSLTVTRMAAQTSVGRALVISEASGKNGSADLSDIQIERDAGQYNLDGMAAMLSRMRVGGQPVRVSKMQNPASWAAVRDQIQSTFRGATASDTNYLYIHAHGGADDGEYYLWVGANSYVSIADLKATLDAVPGRFVLIVESCYSGSMILRSGVGGSGGFAQAFVSAFASGNVLPSGKGDFASSKYSVLCAAGPSEPSWMVSAGSLNGEQPFNGSLFTYSVCRAAGWNLCSRSALPSMQGDANSDGSLSVQELYTYTRGLTSELMNKVNQWGNNHYTQTVCAYPSGSDSIILVD